MDQFSNFPILRGFTDRGGMIDLDGLANMAIAADAEHVWAALPRLASEPLVDLLARLERELTRCLLWGRPAQDLTRNAA